MRILASWAFVLLSCAGVQAASQPAVNLLADESLAGWELITTPAADLQQVCQWHGQGILLVNSGEPRGYLATKANYANYTLHAEWRWTGQPGNSGVLVHISSGPKDRVWPVCFQVQTKRGNVGDLLPMAGATFAETLSTAPDAKTPQRNHTAPDSEMPAGEWNSCEIQSVNGTLVVTINGVPQNRVSGCSVTSGRIGFQLEGTAFELRNVQVTPLQP